MVYGALFDKINEDIRKQIAHMRLLGLPIPNVINKTLLNSITQEEIVYFDGILKKDQELLELEEIKNGEYDASERIMANAIQICFDEHIELRISSANQHNSRKLLIIEIFSFHDY